MKYPNIASTLQWTEVPDVQEGLFLQPAEAAAIDTAMATNIASLETANESVTSQATKITELEGQVTTATTERDTAVTDLTKANEDLAAANTRIAELELLSGKETKTTADADKFTGEKTKASDFAFQKELNAMV